MRKHALLLGIGSIGILGLIACGKDDKVSSKPRIVTKEELLKIENDPNHGICPETANIYTCTDPETKEEFLFSAYAYTDANEKSTLQFPSEDDLSQAMGITNGISTIGISSPTLDTMLGAAIDQAFGAFNLDGKVSSLFGIINYVSSCNNANTLKLKMAIKDKFGLLYELKKTDDNSAQLDGWLYDSSDDEETNTKGQVVHHSSTCKIAKTLPSSVKAKSVLTIDSVDAFVENALAGTLAQAEAAIDKAKNEMSKALSIFDTDARKAVSPYVQQEINVELKEPALGNSVSSREPIVLNFYLIDRDAITYYLREGFVGPTDNWFGDDFDFYGSSIYLDGVTKEVFINGKNGKLVIGSIDERRQMSIKSNHMVIDKDGLSIRFKE